MAMLKIHVCGRRSNDRYDRTDSYIAANIQVQCRVIGVHPTGLTVTRGVGMCPQGSPGALASAGRRRGQRSKTAGLKQQIKL